MRGATVAAAGLTLLACLSCSPAKPAPLPDPRARLYQLAKGSLTEVHGPAGIASRAALPWTVQERVADLAVLGETLWLGVNGYGLASLSLPAASEALPKIATWYDSLLFANRTITTLLPREEPVVTEAGAGSAVGGPSILIHLYFNAALNTVRADDLKARGLSFLSFAPGAPEPDYTVVLPPFHRSNPDWEAVGIAVVSERELLVEWKLAAEEIRFAWTRFLPDGRVEAPSTREHYMRARGYRPVDESGTPSAVRRAVDALASAGTSGADELTVLFAVRTRGEPVKRTWRSGSGDRFVTVPVFVDGSDTWALTPAGRVLLLPFGGSPSALVLPELPTGGRYTDLLRFGDWLVVPWEEARFTAVGAAGLLLYRLGPEVPARP